MKSFVLVGLAVIAVTLHECLADLHCDDTERIDPYWYKWVQWSGQHAQNRKWGESIFRIRTPSDATTVARLGACSFGYSFTSLPKYRFRSPDKSVGDPLVEELTSEHWSRFHWIPTNTSDLKYLMHKHLVVGGCVDAYPVLIGRTIGSSDEYNFGAIIVKPDKTRFEYVYGDAFWYESHQQKDFEVLTFDDSCL